MDAHLKVFCIRASGKIKPNMILAYDIAEAIVLFAERYPKFVRHKKTITQIDKPCILY